MEDYQLKRLAPHEVLAFVHIEKAAGTTVNHVLRRCFPLRYLEAKPLHRGPTHFFDERDLTLLRRINPFVRCISGHSVNSHSRLADLAADVHFITVLRHPINRCLSQYNFWRQRLGKQISADEFLADPTVSDYQTKKIAGRADLEKAKRLIANRYLVVGTVEEFDSFLVLLAHSIGARLELMRYERRNVASGSDEIAHDTHFIERLIALNQTDLALYDYVRGELSAAYQRSYGPTFQMDLQRFRTLNQSGNPSRMRRIVDLLYRAVYADPRIRNTRVRNGLPPRGSYSTF